jgi:peptidoglycan/LPS O-acetylase OafA/YrhL
MEDKNDIRSYFNLVRASAILGIFFYHIYDFNYGLGSVGKRFSDGILQNIFAGAGGIGGYLWGVCQLGMSLGNKGVELFIIASGFGLYLSYLQKRTSWKDFYKKRVVRILPLYWAACLTIYLIFPVNAKHLLMNALLVQIFTRQYLVFGPMWFISYLFLLYLLFPLFVLAFRNRYVKWGLFAVSFVMTPMWKGVLGFLGLRYGGLPPTEYIQVFLLGMLLADSVHNRGALHRCVLHASIGTLSVVGVAAMLYLVSYQVPPTALAHRALGILIFLSLTLVSPLVRRFSFLDAVSRRLAYAAYAIYLTHMLVLMKVLLLADSTPWLRKVLIYPRTELAREPLKFVATSLVILAVTLALSYALQRAYDKLAGRLLVSRRDAAATQPGSP